MSAASPVVSSTISDSLLKGIYLLLYDLHQPVPHRTTTSGVVALFLTTVITNRPTRRRITVRDRLPLPDATMWMFRTTNLRMGLHETAKQQPPPPWKIRLQIRSQISDWPRNSRSSEGKNRSCIKQAGSPLCISGVSIFLCYYSCNCYQ